MTGVVDTREPSRNYPVPYAGTGMTPSNNLDADMKRVAQALALIGVDVSDLITAVSQKADIDHGHAMSAIIGLVDALASKAPSDHVHSLDSLSDVSTAGVTAYQVLAFIAGAWQPWAVDLSHVTGTGILRVDQPQTLTAGEKAQACANIGAAALASPAFTGAPTVPTVSTAADSLGIVNVTALRAAIAALVASSPATLDTLNELATALGNDANFATTMATALAGKQASSNFLTSIAGLGPGATNNKILKTTGANAGALVDPHAVLASAMSIVKGDLMVGTAAATLARLGVGTSGQLLTAKDDGSVAWAAAPSSGVPLDVGSGNVGSFFVGHIASGNASAGSTYAGSNLRHGNFRYSSGAFTTTFSNPSFSGTWRALTASQGPGAGDPQDAGYPAIFQRIV